MADLTISTAVIPSDSAVTETLTLGYAGSAGDLVYMDTADSNKAKAADADAEASAVIRGILATGGASGERCLVVRKDSALVIGATLTIPNSYVASTTAAGIAPEGDLTSGKYVSYVGRAVSTTALEVDFTKTHLNTGLTVA